MPPHRRALPSSTIGALVDRAKIDALLEPWVRDAEERAFVVRCVLGEGPVHHRVSNYVLLSLLKQVLDRVGGPIEVAGPTVDVPMRLPPHIAAHSEDDDFPLHLPTGPLESLAAPGSPAHQAMIDCLTDGPPQHALANAAMVWMLGSILARLEGASERST